MSYFISHLISELSLPRRCLELVAACTTRAAVRSPHDGPLCRSFWGDPRAFLHQHVLMLSVRISRVIKPTQAEPATLDIEQDRAKTRELRGVPRTPIAQQLALVIWN